MDQPWGHVIKNGVLKPLQHDNAPVMDPAGRVHCTISDWGRFVSIYFADTKGKPKLPRTQTLRELHTPGPVGDYAGGWIVTKRSWAGGETLTHAGSNTMWYCVVWAAPKRNFAVLVATNVAGEGVPKSCDDAAAALIDWHAKHGPAAAQKRIRGVYMIDPSRRSIPFLLSRVI